MDVKTELAELKQRVVTLNEYAAEMESRLIQLGRQIAEAEAQLAAFRTKHPPR